jgi:hypothetical protein
MDFGTVKRKLARNAYRSFEQFEVSLAIFCRIRCQRAKARAASGELPLPFVGLLLKWML